MTLSSREQTLLEQWQKEEQAPFSGWDFSYLDGRLIESEPPWSYEALVGPLMSTASSVLDLGTGGGERLLQFKELFPPCVAVTEGYAPNLKLARERLEPLGVEVVESENMLEEKLPFESGSFDLILNRHTGFNSSEIERILAPGGTFLTEQVDGRCFDDLSAAFGCVQPWTFFTLDFVMDKLAETELVVKVSQEWAGKSVFQDVGAIVYYLKAVPWTVEHFSVQQHLPQLLGFQQQLERGEKLAFTERLMLVKAVKP